VGNPTRLIKRRPNTRRTQSVLFPTGDRSPSPYSGVVGPINHSSATHLLTMVRPCCPCCPFFVPPPQMQRLTFRRIHFDRISTVCAQV
jgi:hypothetical protein